MRASTVREPDDSRSSQARSTSDLLSLENQLRTARQPTQAADTERQKRMEEIRQAIANGTYKVDGSAISKAILRRELP